MLDFILGILFIPRSFSEFRIKDSYYHHGLLPNQETQAIWGPIIYPFYTNELGFRDSHVNKIELKKDDANTSKRILIMGDSHSEGVGLPFQYTFSGRLKSHSQNNNTQILNASAVSYSPKIHYLKADYLLNHKGLEVDEIWVICDISDLQNEIAYENFQPVLKNNWSSFINNLNRFIRRNSFVGYSIYNYRKNKEIKEFDQILRGFNQEVDANPNANALELYKDFFSHFDDEQMLQNPDFHGVGEWIYNPDLRKLADQGLNLAFDNLSRLNHLCKSKNIRMRLSVHPWQTQVLKGDTTDYYSEQWRKFCMEENIDFINLYPLFINHENPHYVNKTCYIEGDNHWNEIGNKRVAEYLIQYIE